MIRLSQHITPSDSVLLKLKTLQTAVNEKVSFEEKSTAAKTVFKNQNKKGNTTFDAIKVKLTEMCSGAERCVYCEDSKADEVEHIFPKDLYPEKCFDWNNYVYACGTCNGPKNNQFAIFENETNTYTLVNIKIDGKIKEPPSGEPALINPRIEDPMDYCILDIKETFKFVIIAPKGSREYQKAFYTYNQVLRLNEQREYLRQARKNAYENYKSRLYFYSGKKKANASQEHLQYLVQNLKAEAHITVWKEMQRWHKRKALIKVDKELDDLFILCPEALTW